MNDKPIFTNCLGLAVEIDIGLKIQRANKGGIDSLNGLDNLHYVVDGLRATVDFDGQMYQIEIKPVGRAIN